MNKKRFKQSIYIIRNLIVYTNIHTDNVHSKTHGRETSWAKYIINWNSDGKL